MNREFPILKTERLLLDQPCDKDVDDIVKILNDDIYYQNTINIPKTYTIESAHFWISLSKSNFDSDMGYIFAIRIPDTKKIIGGIGLGIDKKFNKAELGYWLCKNYWNKSFTTEAVKAIIKFGFEDLKLKRIFASHFDFNIASGKVMENAGMSKEGILKCHTQKEGKYQDHALYAIINDDI